jgi:hypothetical protein
MAWIAGEFALAEKLADMMWDPPDADYIGPRSEVCTIFQQRLAYAVKHLLKHDSDAIAKNLRSLLAPSVNKKIAAMGKMVRGLAEPSEATFGDGLQELLFFHRREARKGGNRPDVRQCFSLGGVGLSILAVRRRLLKKAELPVDDGLPLDLIWGEET